MDIYPARELPIKGITSEWLLDKIDNKHKEIVKTGLNKDHFRN
jgi:UDP-N-acetylmuramate--alanine ligase